MAFVFETDKAAIAFVGLFTGPGNSDDDFAQYLQIIRTYATPEHAHGVGVLVVDPGCPPPNAAWRRRLAEFAQQVPSTAAFALVTSSQLVRGASMALSWLRPVPYKFGVFATFDDAVCFIEKHRGEPVPALPRMLRFVRARATSLPPPSLTKSRR